MNELQTFLLEDSGIRGALVRLDETWRQVQAQHVYSPAVRALLGDAVIATVLLASGLKAKPAVSLQLQGEGPLRLLVIQCTSDLKVRGMAQGARDAAEPLLGGGKLVVNVDTGGPSGFFQGVVPLVNERLDACLEAYFAQSEQLPTRLVLRSAGGAIAGLLLQVLPGRDESEADAAFDDAAAYGETVTAEELTSLPADVLLPKLFAGQAIRVFTPRPVVHDCRCTPERLAGIVRMLGGDECRSILADQGHVELTCEFCNRAFRYDDAAVETILGGGTSDSARVH
jgi:molecular chaperone Hsp33